MFLKIEEDKTKKFVLAGIIFTVHDAKFIPHIIIPNEINIRILLKIFKKYNEEEDIMLIPKLNISGFTLEILRIKKSNEQNRVGIK